MILVIQKVKYASVYVYDDIKGSCEHGLLILVGVKQGDTEKDAEVLAKKCANLRIFEDANEKMNLSVKDISGEILCISQFTLLADTKKGNRPSFINAEEPQKANMLFEYFCDCLMSEDVKKVSKGVFGADMQVKLLNDGPVTIIYDSKQWIKND
ncbi:MAG: D-aminoacyl-tRNA deacylase [Candidatus Fimenecus sp.]